MKPSGFCIIELPKSNYPRNNNMSQEKVKRCCKTCEFSTSIACMGYGKCTDNGKDTYEMKIEETEKMFPNIV